MLNPEDAFSEREIIMTTKPKTLTRGQKGALNSKTARSGSQGCGYAQAACNGSQGRSDTSK